MNKKLIISILCVIGALALVLGGYKFYQFYASVRTNFPDNTTINGVDVSGMSEKEAKEALTSEWNSKNYVIMKGDKQLAKITNLDFEYDIDQGLHDLIDPNIFKTAYIHLSDKKKSYDLVMTVKKDTKNFTKQVNKMSFLNNDYTKKTKDAYVDLSNTKFKIVKEVYGDNIDKKRFKKAIKKDISKGTYKMDYNEKDYYDLPEVKSDDEELADYQKWCEKNLVQKITYEFYDGSKETVSPKELKSMLKYDKDNQNEKKVSKKGVEKYIYSLAYNHNTAYASRTWTNHAGKKIVLSAAGNYGYRIDRDKEEERMIEMLEDGEDHEVEVKYKQVPYSKSKKTDDIGDNYCEIDLSNQTLYLVKKGKTIMTTSIVSGDIKTNHTTPAGVYPLYGKQRNTTLRGNNADGSTYESPVSYWMPFNGGIGCHDATWRSSFGGSIYLSNGSHGCINMPTWAAATLYKNVEKGFPFVLYY